MKHLKRSLTLPLSRVSSRAAVFFLVVAIIGFADAAYLTIEHYRGVIPPCTTDGCEIVLTSSYATILGVPVAVLGIVNYLFLAIIALVYLESKHVTGEVKAHHSAILKWGLFATVLGFIGTLYFLYLQQFVIHAYCQYCLGSAAVSIILFATAITMLRSNAKSTNPSN